MLLFNYTFDCHLAFKIFYQGIDFIPSCINTVFGTFQRYLRKMASKIYFWNRNKHFFLGRKVLWYWLRFIISLPYHLLLLA